MEPNAAPAAQGVLGNIMNWDPVAWMSVLMVIIAVVIFVFLIFKVKKLMNQDAEAHKNQPR
jgi:flagellar biogenesis protein FliO